MTANVGAAHGIDKTQPISGRRISASSRRPKAEVATSKFNAQKRTFGLVSCAAEAVNQRKRPVDYSSCQHTPNKPLSFAPMDEILAALIALIHWRLVLSAIGSIAMAVALSHLIPAFTAAYCITLVIFGTTFGMVWQGRADSGLRLTEKTEEPPMSWPVAFFGVAFIGLIAGGFFAELFGSQIGGAIALSLSAGVITLWFKFIQHRTISLRSLVFYLVALLTGYSLLLFLAVWKSS